MTIGHWWGSLINQHRLLGRGWWKGVLDPRNTAEGTGMPWKVLVTYPRAELVNELCAHPAVSPQELLVNVVSRDLFCCLKAVSCETRVPGRL